MQSVYVFLSSKDHEAVVISKDRIHIPYNIKLFVPIKYILTELCNVGAI